MQIVGHLIRIGANDRPRYLIDGAMERSKRNA